MFGSLGLPELILLIIIIGLPIPAVIFALGYYFGRRSARRDTNVTPADATSGPPHV
jgi:lipopolysaccharide biosynthesis regulator YciM